MSHLIVAIDGPAASGKSSTARLVAKRLGFCHVDSGSLYRAATAAALRRSGDADRWSEEDVRRAVGDITLRPVAGAVVPLLEGEELGEELRGAEVTRHVSRVAQMPRIREWVNELVRTSASSHSVVVDGRDIGTVVFPHADLKVFLVADPWERARRRLLQRSAQSPSDEEIAAETERLVLRDARDATQTVQARDAVLIDTTHLTQDAQVERIVALVKVLPARK
ncbi:MAG TPA: (d)CMP kinase [Gemmatimonadaceae bacterium]|jgi:cytidylate kinase|nr:(d)CMP kinase [Gemmatimonadaceae bacterium]